MIVVAFTLIPMVPLSVIDVGELPQCPLGHSYPGRLHPWQAVSSGPHHCHWRCPSMQRWDQFFFFIVSFYVFVLLLSHRFIVVPNTAFSSCFGFYPKCPYLSE